MCTIPFLDIFDREFKEAGQHCVVHKARQVTLPATGACQVGTQGTVSVFGHHK